jgi:predicted dehydrogenase
MKLRVGIVGLGNGWAVRHRPALRSLADRFDVVAVCDEVAVRAEQAAKDFEAAEVDGFRALANRDDVDAVLVLSPQWFGPMPILACCGAGKAIYYAATLDFPADQASLVRRRVEESGVAFMAEFPRRHSPATIRLKELVATRLGKPRLMYCHHRAAVEPGNGERKSAESSPGVRTLLELVDWCRYVAGDEPTSVMGVAHRASAPPSAIDYRMMNLDFSADGLPGTGTMAQISFGHYMPSVWTEAVTFRPPAALQVVCEQGVAFVDLPSTLIWFDRAGRHLESLEHERPVDEQMLLLFHRTVTSLVRQTSGLDDGFRALQIVRASQESEETGCRVALHFDKE